MYNEWQRPKTTRMYIQPPKSERFYTLWREGKVIFGEIQQPITEYEIQTSAGIWFMRGDGRAFDYHKAEYFIREDGIPTHSVKNKLGNKIFVTVESFASVERKSTCYVKLSLLNPSESDVSERIGFMLRSGKECELVFQSPDVYASYDPDIAVWRRMPSDWRKCEFGYTDGVRNLRCVSELDFEFDETSGEAYADFTIPAGECREVVFSYDIGKTPAMDYDAERARTISFWEGELARINKLPENIAKNFEQVRLIKNLTVQLLQMFCYPVGEDLLLARQGGLQRQVWAFETMSVLEALHRTGDFSDYIEPIIDSYFDKFYNESGEVTPLSISWAMITGNALYSFAKYARVAGREYFERYRERALQSYRWIKNTRVPVGASDNLVPGLFPPKSSCDDPLVFQSWGNTDTFNLRGLLALAETLEYFSDEMAGEVRAEYNDYLSVMRDAWQKISDREKSDEIAVPFSPNLPDELIAPKFTFGAFSGYMVEGLDMDPSDVERIINYNTRRGVIGGGLYDRMPDHKSGSGAGGSAKQNLDENGNSIVWYVSAHDYYWFEYFLRHGMRDRCEQMIRANEKYAMTDEYYMIERYNQRDVWFAPWSPNASANGRTINMMLDFCSK